MIVRLSEVTKTYRKGVKALDDLSYEVRKVRFRFVGTEQQRKTTHQLPFGSIEIRIRHNRNLRSADGARPLRLKSANRVIPQNVAVFYELTVEENIDYFCGLYVRITASQETGGQRSSLSLWATIARFTEQTVRGLQRRLNIACGIAHKPRLIIFDEPTVGVDPKAVTISWKASNA